MFSLAPIGHIAIIMDGNGRWARKRSRPRFWGHVRGSKIVSEIVEAANDFNVNALTLYAFSTENWSRPIEEIAQLFRLLKKYIIKERDQIIQNDIRFKVIGDISKLPESTKQLIRVLEQDTMANNGLKLNFAFGYGSRKEIVNAVNFYIAQNPGKPINEEDIEQRLLTNGMGSVDLLIRTGGESRISNFLLWQNAYAEFQFTPTLWPDFNREEFAQIIQRFQQSERRFGTVGPEVISFEGARKLAHRNQSLIRDELGSLL